MPEHDETPNTSPQYRTRLQVLFAQRAKRAVILRRGPKRHFNLLTWDMKTDTFTSGQWMKGIVKLCDLSPSGDKLLYWAAQYHASAPRDLHRARAHREGGDGIARPYDPAQQTARPKKQRSGRKTPRYLRPDRERENGPAPAREIQGVWTAISTPPFFSALAIWPCYGHWTGGGIFRSEREVVLFEDREGITPVVNVPIPARMRITPALSGGKLEPDLVDCAYNPQPDLNDASFKVTNALIGSGAKWVDWVNTRAGNDLLFACDGCVYRLPDWKAIHKDRYLKDARLLADLRPLQFQMKRAPSAAMRW